MSMGETRERPILFSAPMVRAILDGRKTQTRRIVRDDWKPGIEREWMAQVPQRVWEYSPHGQPGDRLWVRETWRPDPWGGAYYRATAVDAGVTDLGWCPSIHMPRKRARILLEVTGVRVERLQDISEEDAQAEGLERRPDGAFVGLPGTCDFSFARAAFAQLWDWDSINGKRAPWKSNPWVWVIEFQRAK